MTVFDIDDNFSLIKFGYSNTKIYISTGVLL